jgi:hypothetical protein
MCITIVHAPAHLIGHTSRLSPQISTISQLEEHAYLSCYPVTRLK